MFVLTIHINLNDLALIEMLNMICTKMLNVLDCNVVSNLKPLRIELQKIFCSAFCTVTIRA